MKIFKKVLKFLLRAFIVIIVLVCISAAGVYGGVQYLRWQADVREDGNRSGLAAILVPEKEKEEKITALFMGVNGHLTDFIMLASYDPNVRTLSLLSIPRDTKVEGTVDGKINSAYGGRHPEKSVEMVKQVTGIEAQYYIIFDTKMLRTIVDEIGGVTVDVPINMNYDDPEQSLYIHLKKGTQTLDGKKAEQFVRFRKNNDGTGYANGDVGRVAAQQTFIKAAIGQVLKPQNLLKINKLVQIVLDNTKTNATMDDILGYLDDAAVFRTDRITMGTLPGEGGYATAPGVSYKLSYFFYDKEKTKELIQELFLKDSTEEEKKNAEEEAKETMATSNVVVNHNRLTQKNEVIGETIGDEVESTSKSTEKLRIQVLNASNSTKNLTGVAEKLNENGYYVAKTGNYNSTENEKSRIIDYTGRTEVEDIKALVGIKNLEQGTDNPANVDITIILGNAYKLD